jgi:phosphoribosylformylglycinamidine synthase
VDLAAERRLGEVLRSAAAGGLVSATHDLSEGGLAQALVELCLINGIGAVIDLPAGADPFVALFSESTARMVVTVPGADADRFTALCDQHGQPLARLGAFTPDAGALDIAGVARLDLGHLRTVWEGTLPALFG